MNEWATACLDWEKRIIERRTLVPDLPLFREEADLGLRVFKQLRIPDIIGTPRNADACGPWMFPFVEALFGSYDPVSNRRMIKEYFALVPKGNNKSSGGGGIMLSALIINKRPEAEYQIVAPTIKVALTAFNQAANTIKADPDLFARFQIITHLRTIQCRSTGVKLMVRAADTDVVTGGKEVGTLIDETHVFSTKARAPAIFLELRGALAKRPDGFLLQITTQSKERPTGIFKQELESARAVRDGQIDLPLLPMLYEFPQSILDDDQWKNEDNWSMVNPNLDRSVDRQYLKTEMKKAELGDKSKMTLFASQHFNIEIGQNLSNDRWRGADSWEAAGDPLLTLDALLERSEVCTIGVDGGGLDDLYGIAVCGRCKESGKWLFWGHAWLYREQLALRPEIAQNLLDFEADGDLTLCDYPDQDITEAAEICVKVRAAGLLPKAGGIGLDPIAIGGLVDLLASHDLVEPLVVGVKQGGALASAIWTMERKLQMQAASHGASAMMAWCVGNAKAEPRGNAIYISKELAGKSKIDPLIAMFNATKLMENNPVAASARVPQMFVL